MNGQPKPKITTSQIIWVVACVILLTCLFLIGAWLFRPASEASSPLGKVPPGKVTEQEVNAPGFSPEGSRPASPVPRPPIAQQPPEANGAIPTPPALASGLPSQMAQQPGTPKKESPAAPAPAAPVVVPAPATAPPAKAPPGTAPAEAAKSPPAKVEMAKAPPPKDLAALPPKAEPKESPNLKGVWYLQVAAVSDKKRAQELQTQLKTKGFPSSQVTKEGGLYKVRIPYRDEGGARAAKKKLDGAGIQKGGDAFVVKPDK
jgi:cell division protein FtsN